LKYAFSPSNQEGGFKMNILLAVDGSEHAQAALDLLKSLPLPIQSTVTIIAVADAPNSRNYDTKAQVLEKAYEQLKSPSLAIKSTLLHGHPAHEIVQFADANKPDLIMMGAKGLRATFGILLGGVAQQVVEHADWPVLVTRAPHHGLNRILLVLDGSTCSQNALAYLVQFPIPVEAQVILMHVLPPTASEQEIMTATWAAGTEGIMIRPTFREELELAQKEEEEHCETLLTQALEKCKEKYLNVSSVVKRGDAATEILKYHFENPVDLIVAGSRGLSAISGWLLGSVSRKIVHYAGCSVLIVKGEHCKA
jgi:nucleotide-binding universal stress UspA family protein